MNAANWIGLAMVVGTILGLYFAMGVSLGFREVTLVWIAGFALAMLIVVGLNLMHCGEVMFLLCKKGA